MANFLDNRVMFCLKDGKKKVVLLAPGLWTDSVGLPMSLSWQPQPLQLSGFKILVWHLQVLPRTWFCEALLFTKARSTLTTFNYQHNITTKWTQYWNTGIRLRKLFLTAIQPKDNHCIWLWHLPLSAVLLVWHLRPGEFKKAWVAATRVFIVLILVLQSIVLILLFLVLKIAQRLPYLRSSCQGVSLLGYPFASIHSRFRSFCKGSQHEKTCWYLKGFCFFAFTITCPSLGWKPTKKLFKPWLKIFNIV